MAAAVADAETVGLTVRPLAPGFGAEVGGMEPRLPLDPATAAALFALFDERGLLVFRDSAADLRFQTYLAELLSDGDVSDPDALPLLDGFRVSNREARGTAPTGRLLFHADMMWVEGGCRALSLYGAQVEQPAVPTLFVSLAEGWDTLPAPLREAVAGRRAIHCQDATPARGALPDDVLVTTFETETRLTLPVGYVHPRTGRTLLYVCPQMTLAIEGMAAGESEALLARLFDHLYAEERVLAHHWREGDLVVWDNVALQHARPNVTTQGPARTLRKAMAPSPIGRGDRVAVTRVGRG